MGRIELTFLLWVSNMKVVLSTFRDSRFDLSHSFTLTNSLLTSWHSMARSSPLINTIVSSAKLIKDNLLAHLLVSLTYKLNKCGEVTDP